MNYLIPKQWQTWRAEIAANDTLLTNYNPDDLTAAVLAKMISVHPATLIAIRCFGMDADNEVATITISGWMNPKSDFGPGIGHRLWNGTATLGAKRLGATGYPTKDGQWATANQFEVDTYTESAYTNSLNAYQLGNADGHNILVLPCLGYTHLLLEAVLTSAALFGAIWRPLQIGEVNQKMKALA